MGGESAQEKVQCFMGVVFHLCPECQRLNSVHSWPMCCDCAEDTMRVQAGLVQWV